MSARKIAVAFVAGVGALFAFVGGEYSTLNWWQMRQSVRTEQQTIERLRADVDSLDRLAEQLENDPAVQERIAREWYGMVRPGETLYRIVPRD